MLSKSFYVISGRYYIMSAEVDGRKMWKYLLEKSPTTLKHIT